MSITTGRGDAGETDLLFGKKAAKTSLRIAALGEVDELNAALGVARVHGVDAGWVERVDRLQSMLVGVMGELATLPEDRARYVEKGFARLTMEQVEWVRGEAAGLEACEVRYEGWARPGEAGCIARAQADMARAVARRAERAVLILHEDGGEVSQEVRVFFNRLSDLLWLMARAEK